MSNLLFDTNAWVGRWPFAPVANENLGVLRKLWRKQGVKGGWVSDLAALWLLDPTELNASLMAQTADVLNAAPLPILNLLDPAWREQLAPLLADEAVPAVRLAPSYGGWSLSAAAAVDAVEAIHAAGKRVVLTVRLIDERHEHPAVKVKPVPVKTIARWLGKLSGPAPLLHGLTRWEVEELAKLSEHFLTDLSYAEWTDSVGVLAKVVGVKRLVFGSLSPLHEMQAQVNKVAQSPQSAQRREAVGAGNWQRWISQ